MNQSRSIQAISRTAMFSALTVVFYYLWKLPLVNVVGSLLLPMPLAVIGYQFGPRYLFMGLLSVIAVMGFCFGPVSLFFYTQFALCSLVFGLGFYYRTSLKKILWAGSLGLAFYLWFSMVFGASLAGFDYAKQVQEIETTMNSYFETQLLGPAREELNAVSSEYQELLSKPGTAISVLDQKKARIEELKEQELMAVQAMEHVHKAMQNPMPFFIFFEFVYLLISLVLMRSLMVRLNLGTIPEVGFQEWKCPAPVSALFLVSFIAMAYMGGNSSAYEGLKQFLTSFAFTMQLMYFLFGLSLVTFVVSRFKVSRAWKVAAIALSFLFMNFLVIIGIVDSFINFRKGYSHLNKGA